MKSINNWLCCGDRNKQFYQATTKARFVRNIIHAVTDSNGLLTKVISR